MTNIVNLILTNWKTSLAGAVWIVLYMLEQLGVHVPGVAMDPSGLAVAIGLLLARDAHN